MRRPMIALRVLFALALAVVISSCGGDDGGEGGGGYDRVYDYATGADDTVVRLDFLGGVQPEGFEFMGLPAVLIAGDGSVYTPAPVVTPYPGPLLPQMSVRELTPAGIDAVLAAADANQLLDEAAPAAPTEQDPDVESVRVELNAEGGSFVHLANLSGPGTDEAAGTQLQAFVEVLQQLETVAGPAQLGISQAFVPEEYRIRAVPVDPADVARNGTSPEVVVWPLDVGTELRGASDCALVEASAVRGLFEAADQVTLFQEGSQAYQLFVVPRLPVDPGC